MERLESSRAEKEQTVPGVMEGISDSKSRLEKDRSSMAALEAQARALSTDLQLSNARFEGICSGKDSAGAIDLQLSTADEAWNNGGNCSLCRHAKLMRTRRHTRLRWQPCSSVCTRRSPSFTICWPSTCRHRWTVTACSTLQG